MFKIREYFHILGKPLPKESATYKELHDEFKIHELTIQDLVNGKQRNKFESYDNYNVIFLRNFDLRSDYKSDTVVIWAKDNTWVITLDSDLRIINSRKDAIKEASYSQEYVWDLIRHRITYHSAELDNLKQELKDLEEDVLRGGKYHTNDIFKIKRVISNCEIEVEDFWFAFKNLYKSDKKSYYFMDLKDHSQRFLNRVNKIENSANLLMSIDRDVSDARTNDINKILTMVATAFVPPTFICSVYGMNFKNMPELTVSASYPLFWAFIGVWGVTVYFFFKKKKWI